MLFSELRIKWGFRSIIRILDNQTYYIINIRNKTIYFLKDTFEKFAKKLRFCEIPFYLTRFIVINETILDILPLHQIHKI